ncbi:hypothetical protein [Streptomyces sp. NBC_01565]|uniref:hypothetical protein n=1 Tax=Streptomyces sp. NBC_01565 TaxID=2975881 RepID=UPI00224EB4DF|nr:hypothetical protein [Streptomyces sp. NBC_01565]MCX4543798.1 hypothetical protein [Streptomyces sp. NBC_01565]
MTHRLSPWHQPPQRPKKLAQRKAERLARRAQYWGERLAAAGELGPEAVASVTFDRARKELDALPAEQRQRAFAALADVIDRVREAHAQ